MFLIVLNSFSGLWASFGDAYDNERSSTQPVSSLKAELADDDGRADDGGDSPPIALLAEQLSLNGRLVCNATVCP